MKKIIGGLMVAAAVLFVAGNAMAAFSTTSGDLVRIVVDSSGDDVATDLGNLASIQSGATQLTSANGFSTSATGTTSLSADTVYYFVLGAAAGGSPINYSQIFAASTSTSGTLGVNTLKLGSAGSGADSSLSTALGYYNAKGGTTVYTAAPSSGANDYFKTTSYPTLNGLFTSASQLGSVLTNLTTANDVSMDLWSILKGGSPVTSDTGLSLYTNIDASGNIYTTDNIGTASPTPIPPSMLLFVPGLLGLIGLKRRISA
jgi:hypothetical protein